MPYDISPQKKIWDLKKKIAHFWVRDPMSVLLLLGKPKRNVVSFRI